MLLNNPWIKEKVWGHFKKHSKLNENEDRTFPNLWDAAKAVVERKFVAFNACVRKEEKPGQHDENPSLLKIQKISWEAWVTEPDLP